MIKKYLVKFPDPIIKNKNISYINNAYSEYIGSNIFRIIGFKTQNTILGKYYYNSKEKIVCACEDFTSIDIILQEFESLALSTNPEKKINTEISDIMEVLDSSKIIDSIKTKEIFWDMFVVDALIGNTDRHNGNWGFTIDNNTKEISFSPIYDCGSCLNPLLEDKEIEKLDESEIKNLSINCYSCLKHKSKKINYIEFIKKMDNNECNEAIIRVFPKINLESINKFIDNIESINKTRKDFYNKIINIRYSIIRDIYNKINF